LADFAKRRWQIGQRGYVFRYRQLRMLPMHDRVQLSGPSKGGIPLSADYVQRFCHHSAVVAVRCKLANCSLKAVKWTPYKLEWISFIYSKSLFKIELFFVFLSKGQFYKITYRYSFSTCCGGPLYGLAVYSKIRQIREPGFTSRDPIFDKS
jgi:hypothetical protein